MFISYIAQSNMAETDTLGIYYIVFYKYINMEELQLKVSCSVCNTEN